MRVLMLGGTGVLSYDIALQCLSLGYDTYVLNRGNHKDELPKGIKSLICNVRDIDLVAHEIKDLSFDIVIDFLSYTSDQLKMTLSFFETRCSQYIFISSCCVFRRDKHDFPIIEKSPKPNISLPYGVKKYECEIFITSADNLKCKFTIVRPYITYGDTRLPYGIAPAPRKHWTIIGRILANKPIFVWSENGKVPMCTLLHSSDFARIFCQLFLNPKAYNQDINLVGDEVCSWEDYIDILKHSLGKDQIKTVPLEAKKVASYLPSHKDFLKGDRNLDAIFDRSKLKEIVADTTPHMNLTNGTMKTIDSYRSNNYYDGIDYSYDGSVDRMLAKEGYQVSFVDYLGNATLKDRIKYGIHRYVSPEWISRIHKFIRIFR